MHPEESLRLSVQDHCNRRLFLQRSAAGMGLLALAGMSESSARASDTRQPPTPVRRSPTRAPKARRIIFLHQSGAPSHLDLFDPKPHLVAQAGKDLPPSIRMGQRLTGMTSGYSRFPVYPSPFRFQQHGKGGIWLSELWPHLSQSADDLCVIRSMHTDAINHDPASTFVHTGSQIAGRPSFGSWVSYGLGSENSDLPGFVVLTPDGSGRPADQPLYDRLWSSGFLPGQHQGVRLRPQEDAVLFLANPPGINPSTRRTMLETVQQLNGSRHATVGDPEIQARIAQYEMAFRMQTSVPELLDVSREPYSILELYGPDVLRSGSFAANCLLARRLAERDVRFIQLYHRGWDQHFNLQEQIRGQCSDVDQPCHALLTDLKQRGLLDDTLVVWAGEFGRTVYGQGDVTSPKIGRDHHPRCFSLWIAGGGIQGGLTYGSTDEFGYNVVENPVSFFDLNATLLHLLGIDHTQLTYRYQGRDFRLTDVHGEVVEGILA